MSIKYKIPVKISANSNSHTYYSNMAIRYTNANGQWDIVVNITGTGTVSANGVYALLHILKYLLTQIEIYIKSNENLLKNSYFQGFLKATGKYYTEFMSALSNEEGEVDVDGTPIKYASTGPILQEDVFQYIDTYQHLFPSADVADYYTKNPYVKASADKLALTMTPDYIYCPLSKPGALLCNRFTKDNAGQTLKASLTNLVVPAFAALELFRINVTQIRREDEVDKLKTTVTDTLSKVQTTLNAAPKNISALVTVTDKSTRLLELLNSTVHTISGFSYNEIKTEPYYDNLQFDKDNIMSVIKKARDKSFTAPSGNSGNTHQPIQSNENALHAFFDDSGMASTSGSSQINLDNITQELDTILHVNPISQDNVEISNPDIYKDSSGEMIMGYLTPTEKTALAQKKQDETKEFIERIKQGADKGYTPPASARTVFYSMVKADSFRA